MDYKKRIEALKYRITNPRLQNFVVFLETVFEWIEVLKETKRIGGIDLKRIELALPTEILKALEQVSPTESTPEQYSTLKKLLLNETKKFLSMIIKLRDLRLHDFDLLQFNLYQIFGKEELASMIEWARLELEKEIKRRQGEATREKEEEKKEQEEYLAHLRSLPQEELNRLMYEYTFDFTPSAQTKEEQDAAIEKAYQTMRGQKVKFRHFELRLTEAAEEARKKSQSMVFKRIGEVRTEVGETAEKFRKKASFIVSPEGPKKEIKKARQRIREGRKETLQQLEESKKMFTKAQDRVSQKRHELEAAEVEQRKSIKEQGMVQVEHGKHLIGKARQHLKEEEKGTKLLFESARSYLSRGKKHLEREKEKTELLFEKGKGHLAFAREHLEKEKTDFTKRITKEEQRIEEERQKVASLKEKLAGTRRSLATRVAGGKQRIAGERQKVLSLKEKLAGTQRSLATRVAGEKQRIAGERQKVTAVGAKLAGTGKSAEQRIGVVKERLDEQRKGVVGRVQQGMSKPGTASAKVPQKETIQKGFLAKKEKLITDLQQKKEQLAYDVRFKQHSLREKAIKQKEMMTGKFEGFQERQKTVIARHRATSKAKMIRTLLKAIRTMQ